MSRITKAGKCWVLGETMTKFENYLKANKYGVFANSTSIFVVVTYWDFWLKAPLGLKLLMIVIFISYFLGMSYLDLVIEAIKSKDEQIEAQGYYVKNTVTVHKMKFNKQSILDIIFILSKKFDCNSGQTFFDEIDEKYPDKTELTITRSTIVDGKES